MEVLDFSKKELTFNSALAGCCQTDKNDTVKTADHWGRDSSGKGRSRDEEDLECGEEAKTSHFLQN